jgi:hypothetical protein
MNNQVDRHVGELEKIFKNKIQEDDAAITTNSSSNTEVGEHQAYFKDGVKTRPSTIQFTNQCKQIDPIRGQPQ